MDAQQQSEEGDKRGVREGSNRRRDGQSGSRNRRVTASLIRFFHERGDFQYTERAPYRQSPHTKLPLRLKLIVVLATMHPDRV